MTLADILIPLAGSISNEKALKMREACDMQERRVEALEKRVEALSLDVAILVEGTVEAVHEAGLRTLAQRVEALEQIRISHEADYSKSASVFADRIEALDRALSAAAEDNGDLDVRVPALERASAKNTGEGHGVAGSTPAGPSRSTTMPSPASPAGNVPSWVPSADEIQQFIDDGREGDLRSLIASRAPRPWGAFSGEQHDAAAEALCKDFGHSLTDSNRFRFGQAVNVVLRALGHPAPLPAPQPSVEEMAEARYKALSDAARVCDEIAQLMAVKANDANAQRKNEDEDEFDARADTAKHLGMKIRALAKAALSALPAPDEKLGTLPPSKTLNECREVFRRVAKRGPCLSSPDLHGIAAVRDFLTLDEEAFRRNWGPRDEDDDEKCEGGECRHGFDAGGGERLTECEKHGGKPAPSPQPAREAQGEPTLEECETAYEEAWRNADIGSLSVDDIKNPGVAAVRSLCLAHRAPSPSPALAAIVEAGDAMRKVLTGPPFYYTGGEKCSQVSEAWDRARAALPKDGAA